MKKKLTIGMATYDDFDGVFFTTQAIRIANQDRLAEIEFIIIDNNPESAEGKATKDHAQKIGAIYHAENSWRSTATRDLVFKKSSCEWVLCLDPHVLIEPQTISRILKYSEDNPTTRDLFGGVMIYDSLNGNGCTNMKPEWRSQMFGTWEHSPKGANRNCDPFEIPLHGLGLFLQRKKAWQGFNPLFLGFGGEEGYIHEKTRRAGARNICLPWLRWNHRFSRPRGVKYSLKIQERISNYFIGWKENEQDTQPIHDHFSATNKGLDLKALETDVDELMKMDINDALRRRRS
jgi:hypothetical protein